MYNFSLKAIFGLTFFLLTKFVSAEEITLTNHDTLHVSITSIRDNKVYAYSNVLGPLKIPLDKVANIEFQGSYWVKNQGEDEFQFISFNNKKNQNPIPTLPAEKGMSLCQIVEMTQKKPNQVKPLAKSIPNHTGVITAQQLEAVPKNNWIYSNNATAYVDFDDIGSKDGSNKELNASGRSEARKTEIRHILDWGFDFSTESDGDSEQAYHLSYSYNKFLNKKLYRFVMPSYTKDTDESPYQLFTLDSGLGYQLYDTDDLSLKIEGGPGYTFQDYKTDSDIRSLSIYSGISYTQKLTKHLSLNNETKLNTTIKNSSIILTGDAGLKYYLTDDLWLQLSHHYSWTNNPDTGYKNFNGDFRVGIGAGW